jgi:hypothetical protein
MNAERLQTGIMILTVVLLLFAILRIYETFQAKTPQNLEGHIAVEGAMTANPPASDFGSAAPSMQ